MIWNRFDQGVVRSFTANALEESEQGGWGGETAVRHRQRKTRITVLRQPFMELNGFEGTPHVRKLSDGKGRLCGTFWRGRVRTPVENMTSSKAHTNLA